MPSWAPGKSITTFEALSFFYYITGAGPLIKDGRGPGYARDMRAAVAKLQASARAGDLAGSKEGAAAMSKTLSSVFTELGGKVPAPAQIGSGKFLGVISAQ